MNLKKWKQLFELLGYEQETGVKGNNTARGSQRLSWSGRDNKSWHKEKREDSRGGTELWWGLVLHVTWHVKHSPWPHGPLARAASHTRTAFLLSQSPCDEHGPLYVFLYPIGLVHVSSPKTKPLHTVVNLVRLLLL